MVLIGLDFFFKLKCQTSTVILSLGFKYSVCDLIYNGEIIVREPRRCDVFQNS